MTDTETLAAPVPVRPRRVPLTDAAEKAENARAEAEARHASSENREQAPSKAAQARVPFGHIARKIPDLDARPGFTRRWFNDERNRIWRAERAGYTHVIDPSTGKNMECRVGVQDGGAPLLAYAMEIPDEFYDADFAAKQEALNEVDNQIINGVHNQQASDKTYIPRGTTINIGPQLTPRR